MLDWFFLLYAIRNSAMCIFMWVHHMNRRCFAAKWNWFGLPFGDYHLLRSDRVTHNVTPLSAVWLRCGWDENGEGGSALSITQSYQCNCIECAYFYDHSVGIVKFPVAKFGAMDWVTELEFVGATKQATSLLLNGGCVVPWLHILFPLPDRNLLLISNKFKQNTLMLVVQHQRQQQ